MATISGTNARDNLNGTAGADIINGLAGNDEINGRDGDDVISGGTGDDRLSGGNGSDTSIFDAGDGRDTISDLVSGETVQIAGYTAAQSITQSGRDVVVILSPTDQITFQNTTVATVQAALQFGGGGGGGGGTSGNDTMTGTDGDDIIDGLGGNDFIAGGGGSDTLTGGDGEDTLYSGTASVSHSAPTLDRSSEQDTLAGGAGSDTFYAGYGDNVDGGLDGGYGDGLFISFMGATAGITFDGSLATQVIGGGTITGIENIHWLEGSEYDDYINIHIGNGYARGTVYGMGGNDTIIGAYYTEILDGGDGDDVIDARAGYASLVNGGAGDDILYGPLGGSGVVDGGAGNDTIYASGRVSGGDGNDIIHVGETNHPGLVTGDAGNDHIYGSGRADNVHGGAGDDIIDGSGGDDVLSGGEGSDVLSGGAGNDRFVVGDGDTVTDFGAGDTLHIEGSFTAQSMNQVGSDVVITLASGNQVTLQGTNVATVTAALRANVSDIAISPDGSKIYVAGTDGNFYVYDAANGAFLRAWDVGTVLGGMDISPDGTFAVVTERSPLQETYADPWWDNQFTVTMYKIDLSTGEVTTFPTVLTGTEYSFLDVELLADGSALISVGATPGYSASTKLRILDLATGEYAVASDTTQNTIFSNSPDGSQILVAMGNISGAPLKIYESGVGFVAENWNEVSGYNRGVQAFNAEAGLAAHHLYGYGLFVYGADLQDPINLADSYPQWKPQGAVSGLAFSSDGQYLFVLDNQADAVIQLSTADWSVVAQFDLGTDLTPMGGDFGNRLLVAPDTSFVTVVTDDGWLILSLTGEPTEGNDRLVGSAAGDAIDGLGGDDTISGLAGDDILAGGGGNDILRGGAGDDTLSGGEGTDYFEFIKGDGQDTITDLAAGETTRISGYTAAQTIVQSGANVVVSLSATDQITFLNANLADVSAALVFDKPVPTEGDDTLIGTVDIDHINGLGGDDSLYGSGGDDVLTGGPGADTLDGGDGNDVLFSDTASFSGRTGIDTVLEHDVLRGGTGDDRLWAGGGDDVDGGAGFDTLGLSFAGATSGVTLDTAMLVSGQATQVLGGTVQNIERVDYLMGSAFADTLTVAAQPTAMVIYGGGGDDLIIWNTTQGWVYGESGNDTVDASAGIVAFWGDDGDDTLISGAGSDEFLGGAGSDTIDYRNAAAGVTVSLQTRSSPDGDYFFDVENITGSAFADTLIGDGFANVLIGGGGNDTLFGGDANDTLYGGEGNDTLTGGIGNDVLYGGAGEDSFVYALGDGRDVIGDLAAGDLVKVSGYGSAQSVAQSGSNVVVTLSSTDTITFYNTTVATVQAALQFSGGSTTIKGTSAADVLNGTSGNDIIQGLGGNDNLSGLGGNDTLDGGTGADILKGGDGNDTLRGGAGNDTLTGGTGADLFQFESRGGNDKVTDFQTGVDKLDFSLMGITAANVKTSLSRGNLLVTVDANQDGRADFTITLVGVTALDPGDFIF